MSKAGDTWEFYNFKARQKAVHFNNLYFVYRCIPFWSLNGGEGALVLFTIGLKTFICTDFNPDQYKQYIFLRPSAVTKRFFKAKKLKEKKDYIKL